MVGNIHNGTDTYGAKHNGGIKANESVLTEENGVNDTRIDRGSPMDTAVKMHEEWKAKNGY